MSSVRCWKSRWIQGIGVSGRKKMERVGMMKGTMSYKSNIFGKEVAGI